MKFEYKEEDVRGSGIIEALNKFGEDRWEAIFIERYSYPDYVKISETFTTWASKTAHRVILKRAVRVSEL